MVKLWTVNISLTCAYFRLPLALRPLYCASVEMTARVPPGVAAQRDSASSYAIFDACVKSQKHRPSICDPVVPGGGQVWHETRKSSIKLNVRNIYYLQ